MAIEAVKAAAMTYQGSASGAANTVKIKEPAKTEKPEKPEKMKKTGRSASEADDGSVTPVQDSAKPLQPITGGSGDKDQNTGGGNGHQTSRQLQQAVEKLKESMKSQTEAVFGFHEGTNRVMIKIVDKDTKDVIKEYPPEETLDMIQKVWEMAGIMIDERG